MWWVNCLFSWIIVNEHHRHYIVGNGPRVWYTLLDFETRTRFAGVPCVPHWSLTRPTSGYAMAGECECHPRAKVMNAWHFACWKNFAVKIMISHNCQVGFCDDLLIVMTWQLPCGDTGKPSIAWFTNSTLFFKKKREKKTHMHSSKHIYIFFACVWKWLCTNQCKFQRFI